MTIFTRLVISGVTVTDKFNSQVSKTTGENAISSTFSVTIDNFNGINAGSWSLGDEVNIFADKDTNPATTKIFTGILENLNFQGKNLNEKMLLTGKDFTSRLIDRTVEPEVYSNLPAGSIVKDIINKYTDDITVTNVNDSPTIVEKITFKQMPVYDAVQKLAKQANYVFYVDNDKDLHFEEKSTVSSNLTFDSGNVIKSDFRERRDSVFNEVWVYGDKYLDDHSETFTAGSPLGGSIFTLAHNPFNTEITNAGSKQGGGVFGMAVVPLSGTNYLVDFDSSQIIFTSGTTIGDSVPASGNEIIIKYDRALPVIKVGRDNASAAQFGKRVKVITEKSIKDPVEATALVKSKLNELKNAEKEGNINVQGVVDVTPSQTCLVNLPQENVNNITYDIIEARYNFNKSNNLKEEVLRIKVNKRLTNITDKIKDLALRIGEIEAGDISDSDVLTRLEFTTGSLLVPGSAWQISSRTATGSVMIWDNSRYNTWDTDKWGTVGSAFTAYTIIVSGGIF